VLLDCGETGVSLVIDRFSRRARRALSKRGVKVHHVPVDDVEARGDGDPATKVGAWERRTLQSWNPISVLLLGMAGIIAGAALVLSGPVADGRHQEFVNSQGFLVWSATVCLQMAFLAVVAPPLWRELADLQRATNPSRWLWLVPVLIAITLLLFIFGFRPDGPDWPLWGHRPKIRILTLLMAVGVGLPAFYGIALVQDRVRRHRPGNLTPADLIVAIVARDHLRRYLATAGTVIGLAVLAAGALRRALLLFEPTGQAASYLSTANTVLYGAFFTALLLVVYVPAHLTLQRLCVDLLDFHFPLTGMPAPASVEFETWLEGRQRLENLIQVQVTPWQQLQSSLFILAPLLSAVIAGLLPQAI
jgi:hypothetical protein